MPAAKRGGSAVRGGQGAWWSGWEVDDGEGEGGKVSFLLARKGSNCAELDDAAAEPGGAGPVGEGLDGVAEVFGAGVKAHSSRRLAWRLLYPVQLCLEARRAAAVGVGVALPVLLRWWCWHGMLRGRAGGGAVDRPRRGNGEDSLLAGRPRPAQ